MTGRPTRSPRPGRRPGPPARAEGGFTIVELLVAAIILAVGILATASVFASSDTTTLDAELQQIATERAEQAIEEVRSLDYDQIGHTETPTAQPSPPAGSAGLGGGTNPTYDGPDNGAEQLVTPANSENGDSSSGVITPAQQARTFTLQSDPSDPSAPTITGTVYTFVTWRDADCQGLDTHQLDDALNALRDDLYSLRAALNGLRNEVQAVFGGLGLLPDSIQPIYQNTISSLASDLGHRADDLEGVIHGLASATVDICDLPESALQAIQGLVDPSGVGQFTASAEILGVDAQVQAAVDGVNVPLTGGLLCGTLGTFCDDSQNLETTIGTSGIEATLSGVHADADTLSAALNHTTTHDTKRVTVAVTVNTERGDLTPRNTVYLSTVVVDPEDGLL